MLQRSTSHKRPLLPGMLSRLYSNGLNLSEVISQVTRGTSAERETADCLISVGDSLEYAGLMSRSFVALCPDIPPMKEPVRLEQQSTQAEASDCQACSSGFIQHDDAVLTVQLVLRAIETLICSQNDANVLCFGFRKVKPANTA